MRVGGHWSVGVSVHESGWSVGVSVHESGWSVGVSVHESGWSVGVSVHVSVMGSSPTRGSSFFLGKVTALGVLCCFALFVCLTLLLSSLIKTCTLYYHYLYVTLTCNLLYYRWQ